MQTKGVYRYAFNLSIGFSEADRTEVVDIEEASYYTKEQWDALSDKEREEWLNEELSDWQHGYVDSSWAPEED